MAEDNKRGGFFKGLIARRLGVSKGVEVSDFIKLAQDNGYGVVQGRDGKYDVVPLNLDGGESAVKDHRERWLGIDASYNDLVNNRHSRIATYNRMDRSGSEGSVVLDTLADEVVNVTDYTDSSLIIEIGDKELEKRVYEVLENNGVLSNIRSDIRNMCKTGDYAYVLTNAAGKAIMDLNPEDSDAAQLKVPYNPNDINLFFINAEEYELTYTRSRVYDLVLGKGNSLASDSMLEDRPYKPWEYSLFSVGSRDTFPYGMSELEKMRQPFEKLAILEELLAITRSSRLDKIVVTVPGVKGDPTSVLARMSQLKNSLKNIVLGSPGGRVSRNQDTGLTEYIWAPEGFDIKRLSTSLEVGTIEDVEYFRDKLINASRLPKGFFLASEGGGQQRPMSLRQQDIKFARSLIPIGEAYCRGLKKLIVLIAFYLGGDVSKLKVDVRFKKSPYISSELTETYQDAYAIIQTYKEVKSQFSEFKGITDVDVKRILDLIGVPHAIFFPEDEGTAPKEKREALRESRVTVFSSLREACVSDILNSNAPSVPEVPNAKE